jgi:hypothetical protein
MSAWIRLLAVGVIVTAGSTASAQRTGSPTGETAFGTGGSADELLTNPDDVFELERGDTIGASSEGVSGFSNLGGEASSQGGGLGGGRGGMGGAFGGGLGGLGGLFGGGNPFNRSQQQQQPEKQIRTRLRASIQVARPPASQVESKIESRWSSLPSHPRFRNVEIEMQGRTAILNGEVASQEDRRIAELLLRLEPGVQSIENQLSVAGSDAGPTLIPPPQADPIGAATDGAGS